STIDFQDDFANDTIGSTWAKYQNGEVDTHVTGGNAVVSSPGGAVNIGQFSGIRTTLRRSLLGCHALVEVPQVLGTQDAVTNYLLVARDDGNKMAIAQHNGVITFSVRINGVLEASPITASYESTADRWWRI